MRRFGKHEGVDVQLDWNDTVTRRTAVKLGVTAAAATLTTAGTAVAAGGAHQWRRSSYRPLVGQRFSVGGSSRGLRLTGVKDLPNGPAGSEKGFLLIFRAPHGTAFAAHDIPRLHHRAVGTVPMFLSPGSSSSAGQSFVAVVNRLHG
jgi:hypothetical protein